MSITSPDLSVFYKFQWLIGLVRPSISPPKRPLPGSSHHPERTQKKPPSMSDLGDTLPLLSQVRLLPSCSPLLFKACESSWLSWPALWPSTTESSPEAWTFWSSVETWARDSNTPSTSPEILWERPAQHTGGNWGWQDYKDHTHCQDARLPLFPCQQSPGFLILFMLLWYHQKFEFLLQS